MVVVAVSSNKLQRSTNDGMQGCNLEGISPKCEEMRRGGCRRPDGVYVCGHVGKCKRERKEMVSPMFR